MSSSSALIQAPCGPVRAHIDDGLLHARGIRYATAGRFEAPRDVADWTEPMDASARGPACPQNTSRLAFLCGQLGEHLDHTEDCLVLSVTAPADAHDLPVMVWFHGGAYLSGGGEAPKYDPDALVAEGDVVVVTVTYRLGVFGYLTADDDAVTNAGLRDQISALRWVQRNIAAFGGDPGAVTVFGQSAGGDSVLCLIVADGTAGLFHRAILQSAPLGLRFGRHRWTAVAPSVRTAFAEALGGADPRTASVTDLLRAQGRGAAAAAGHGLVGGLPYAPEPGAAPLPPATEWPRRLTEAAARIDLVVTYTRHDAAAFLAMRPFLGRLYRLGTPGRLLLRAASTVTTTTIFGRYSVRPLRAAWRANHGRIRVRRINWSPPGAPLGACHCIELPLLLGLPGSWSDAPMLGDAAGTTGYDEQARLLRGAWAQIAHHGIGGRAQGTRAVHA